MITQYFPSHAKICACYWKKCSVAHAGSPWNGHSIPSIALCCQITALIARFMGPTWVPSGADRTQVGLMLAPWNLPSGCVRMFSIETIYQLLFCSMLCVIVFCAIKFVELNWRSADHNLHVHVTQIYQKYSVYTTVPPPETNKQTNKNTNNSKKQQQQNIFADFFWLAKMFLRTLPYGSP